MASFLACCFLGDAQRPKEDPFQLTPLGPLPEATQRGTRNEKVRQSSTTGRPGPTAAGFSSSRHQQRRQHSSWPDPYALQHSEGLQDAIFSDYNYIPNTNDSYIRGAEADACELFRQAGLPAPEFGGYQPGVPTMGAPFPAYVKFESPRRAPAPPTTTRVYDYSLTKPPPSSSRHDSDRRRRRADSNASGRSTDEHRSKRHRPDRKHHSEQQVHPSVPGYPRSVQSGARSPRHQTKSHRPAQTSGRRGVLSAVLGLAMPKVTTERRRRRQREEEEQQAEQQRQRERQKASEERRRRQEAARLHQRGLEREREREWHTRKQMELRGLQAPVAGTGMVTGADAGGSNSRTRQRQRRHTRTRSRTREGGGRAGSGFDTNEGSGGVVCV